ncbi:hypothetical protein [Methylobacterium oryzihabitans]|uniref:Uncharacterized protein n=1 Tax=Methylobacterium oryzihabitans TaxID=2499852 RepID=A0A3S2VBW3_9HYPH|nr:hypothetical protein [Methylobacterium oryzihabitans]RVU19133.1 hypothetical protein EOE48_09600 [Methylobacterium oryzihabitans]
MDGSTTTTPDGEATTVTDDHQHHHHQQQQPEAEPEGVAFDIQRAFERVFEEEEERVRQAAMIDAAVERWVREKGLNILPFPEHRTRKPTA